MSLAYFFTFILLTCLGANKLFALFATHMGKLASVCAMKPLKTVRPKKSTAGEKRKKSPSPVHGSLLELKDATVEPDQNITEPVAPKKSKSQRKKSTHQEKAIVIRKGTP